MFIIHGCHVKPYFDLPVLPMRLQQNPCFHLFLICFAHVWVLMDVILGVELGAADSLRNCTLGSWGITCYIYTNSTQAQYASL